jgi:hypothetical protein
VLRFANVSDLTPELEPAPEPTRKRRIRIGGRLMPEGWDPHEALKQIVEEERLGAGSETASDNQIAATSRLLREHAILSAQSLAHIAAYGESERTRLSAAKFIVEQTLNQQLEHTQRIHAAQIQQVGRALSAAIRELGLRYGFDPQSDEVRRIARDAMTQVADTGPPPIDATAAPTAPEGPVVVDQDEERS